MNEKNILPPSLNLSICSNCLNLILGYIWRYFFCSSKPEFHPLPWQSLLPGKTGQPSTRETGVMQLHATFAGHTREILKSKKIILIITFIKTCLKCFLWSRQWKGQEGYQRRESAREKLKAKGWAEREAGRWAEREAKRGAGRGARARITT